jgi:hypothetical protein
LQRIAQNFEHLNDLKKALMMPLEGEWDYQTEFTTYIGKKSHHYSLSGGKAIFIGKDDDRTRVGYQVYLGGGIFEGSNNEPVVTLFGDFFLDTNKGGIPKENCSVNFSYLARTASNPDFAVSVKTKLVLTECKLEVSQMDKITSISFALHSDNNDEAHRTDGTVTFTRIP